MRTIELNDQSFVASPVDRKFILLRSNTVDQNPNYLSNIVSPTIYSHKDAHTLPGVWGTLGYENNEPINWRGTIECSNEGNQEFKEGSTVSEEVQYIKEMYPDLNLEEDIKEKVINLSQLEIDMPDVFALSDIPQLRLTIFLKEDEGALAFYQFQKENNEDAELEFIQPQKTGDEHSMGRDRLNYHFNALPNKTIEEHPQIPHRFRLSTQNRTDEFIIKVLIFKRAVDEKQFRTSDELVMTIEEKLANHPDHFLVKKHRLLVFNPKAKNKKSKFRTANIGSIDGAKKTLLLIHGTFASTKGSFGEVYNWIEDIYDETDYEQIIAFDHPTLFFDAEMNIDVLFNKLNKIEVKKFEMPVDLIGTSQGGLLCQHLANRDQEEIPVGKVALVASANGVDYLAFGKGVATGLKIFRKVMRKLGFAPAALVAALLQHSAEWVLKQPGMQVMTPGHSKLNDIIFQTPKLPTTRYLPLAGNYHADGFFKERLELAIDGILSKENDWVVGTKNQFKAPTEYVALADYNPGKFRDYMFNDARHGTLIEKERVQDLIEQFFSTNQLIDLIQETSPDRFDAHLHIFGRNVISGRLLLMILGDLIDYLKKDNPDDLLAPIDLREDEKEKTKFGQIVKNIFRYILFNKNGMDMFHDLEEDYHHSMANTYRFIPLMFDVEMSFRNKYDSDNSEPQINDRIKEFGEENKKLLERLSKALDAVGSVNDDSTKVLKYVKTVLSGLNLTSNLLKETKDSYSIQKKELQQLKNLYGHNIFPFLATDPRRSAMGSDIEELVGEGLPFHGIKLYTPNGYSPTDPHFYEKSESFVHGKCLYQWCMDNDVPIMAHNSDAGFATFTDRLEVFGDICTQDPGADCTYRLEYINKDFVEFQYNLFNGGFDKAVKERAHRLNHPCLWNKVLSQFPDLKICLAHFGGGSEEWEDEIAKLILKYPNVYTDLSCQTDPKRIQTIHDKYFVEDTEDNKKIRNKIMYGSDYFLNMLQDISFNTYYQNFRNFFSEEELEYMSVKVPKEYLGIEK